MHWDFNYIENRFQEWAPDYTTGGETQTDLIPIETIDKVPIAFIASTEDQICPYATAEQTRDTVPAVTSFHTMQGVDHFYYAYATDKEFMDHVIYELENVNPISEPLEFLS